MANRQLVLAVFPDELAADSAAVALKDSGIADGDAIGILALDDDGKLKQDKVGAHSTGKGAAIGGVIAVFSTALLGNFGNDPTALTAYAVNVGLAGLADALMMVVALRANLLEPANQARGQELVVRNLVPSAVFFASIPLAYVDTSIAKYSWLLIAIVPRVMTRAGVWSPRWWLDR